MHSVGKTPSLRGSSGHQHAHSVVRNQGHRTPTPLSRTGGWETCRHLGCMDTYHWTPIAQATINWVPLGQHFVLNGSTGMHRPQLLGPYLPMKGFFTNKSSQAL